MIDTVTELCMLYTWLESYSVFSDSTSPRVQKEEVNMGGVVVGNNYL
jgi:hypothetical protein